MQRKEDVAGHFDAVAGSYDFWKEKNWYYHDALKSIAREQTQGAGSVLDAGCGTGGILATLKNPRLVGIDLSARMIQEATRRHPELSFSVGDIAELSLGERFDRILFFDVIEHVENPRKALRGMASSLKPAGRLVITMANPLWEPILMLAERLRMKMPEGPHHRISARDLIEYARGEGLVLLARDWRLLFPKSIPGFSYFINDVVGRLPLLRRLGVLEVLVFAPEEHIRR